MQLYERLGFVTDRAARRSGSKPVSERRHGHLLRWLRRQLRQPTPLRERLEAAIENDDPAEARRIVARFEFTDAQRHHVERLLDEWERERLRAVGAAHDLDAPGPPGGEELVGVDLVGPADEVPLGLVVGAP